MRHLMKPTQFFETQPFPRAIAILQRFVLRVLFASLPCSYWRYWSNFKFVRSQSLFSLQVVAPPIKASFRYPNQKPEMPRSIVISGSFPARDKASESAGFDDSLKNHAT